MMENPAFRWLVATPLVIFLVFLATRHALFPPVSWHQPSRLPGTPLVKMWVSAPFDACFNDAVVHRVAKRELGTYSWPEQAQFKNLEIFMESQDRLRLTFSETDGFVERKSSIVFEDKGDLLIFERLENGAKFNIFEEGNRPPDLLNCGVYTLKERLQLFYRRPFELRSDV